MFKMIEVVGSSKSGFSEAVKEVIDNLIGSGNKVHFFEVVEQRGAARSGSFKEYQVKLKVAVEAESKKDKGKEENKEFCPTCQEPVKEGGHLCIPQTYHDEKCDWCGALIPDERHLCSDKAKELAYICNSCGRTAISADHLCNPKKIDK
ncbi:MAG: dodecin domain-containing protein [bacterium]